MQGSAKYNCKVDQQLEAQSITEKCPPYRLHHSCFLYCSKISAAWCCSIRVKERNMVHICAGLDVIYFLLLPKEPEDACFV